MNSLKKILYVTTSPRMAGAEKQLYELVTRIDKNKFQVRVVTLKEEANNELITRLRANGVSATSLGIRSKWEWFKIFKLYREIKIFKPDILQSFLFFDNIACRIFGFFARVPVVVSGIRNTETHRSFLRNILDRGTASLADMFVSNSDAAKKLASKREHINPNKIKVIHNGITTDQNISAFHGKENSQEKIIGTIGFLDPQKDISNLLHAMHILLKNKGVFPGPHWQLVVVGDGPLRKSLENTAKSLGIFESVRFLGHQKNAAKLIPSFHMFVLASKWEGLPNVVMEAMASGTFVVATDVGGTPELIEHGVTGLLVPPESPQLLAEMIYKAATLDVAQKEFMIQKALEKINGSFTIEHMVQEFENFYLLTDKKI